MSKNVTWIDNKHGKSYTDTLVKELKNLYIIIEIKPICRTNVGDKTLLEIWSRPILIVYLRNWEAAIVYFTTK